MRRMLPVLGAVPVSPAAGIAAAAVAASASASSASSGFAPFGRDTLDTGQVLAPGYGDNARPRLGFFTDTSLCIGCKACEVACKEWNEIPQDGYVWTGQSYDNTGMLSANSWRHVAFIEQDRPLRVRADGRPDGHTHGNGAGGHALGDARRDSGAGRGSNARPGASDGAGPDGAPRPDGGMAPPMVAVGPGRPADLAGHEPEVLDFAPPDADGMRWLMASDVCKHCTQAACLDVCPTGSLFRTEFGTVVVQQDVCNGCGYCVSACPFGVIDRRQISGDPGFGIAQKCTLCYDRAHDDLEPACAKACPTKSIQWGELADLREHAQERLDQVRAAGYEGARLYGEDPDDGVGGFGAFFLLLDEPEVYGMPPDPVVTTRDLGSIWGHALVAAGALAGLIAMAAIGGGRRR